MSQSVWTDHIKLPDFHKLEGKKKTHVLIIGGGLSGILCAYFLELAGVDYILVEGKRIGSGITKNTTAKITSQHGLIYDKMIRNKGKEQALVYLRANEQALEMYRKLAKTIPCKFEEKNSFVYTLKNREWIEKEVSAVNSLGFPAKFVEKLPLPFETEGAIQFSKQAQFNPFQFIAGLAKNLNIYEHTFITEIAPNKAWNEECEIYANKIIVATHFPFINKNGSYFLKLYQHRSYVIALEHAQNVNGMYVDEAKQGFSFRNYDNLLLLGGGSHRTGKQGGNYDELRAFAKEYYLEGTERYHWATQDCMSLDSVPYIGQYSKHAKDLYVATGFNKWGMTSAMVSAMLLSDLVQEKENEWSRVFSPSRSIWHPQLFLNGIEATLNLLTPTFKRCPHLGCALKWNPIERTWDCPCHGSRFEEDGSLIDNPATGKLPFVPKK